MFLALTTSLKAAMRRQRLASAGTGALRVALLFGSGAIALTLLLTPQLERKSCQALFDPGIDKVVTSSIGTGGTAYLARRSVLQSSPDSVCIISRDGSKRGQC